MRSRRPPTRGWKADDIRFTTKGGILYAIGMERPADGVVRIKTLYAGTPYLDHRVAGISLLGAGAAEWHQTDKALEVTLPAGVGANMPYVLKISFTT